MKLNDLVSNPHFNLLIDFLSLLSSHTAVRPGQQENKITFTAALFPCPRHVMLTCPGAVLRFVVDVALITRDSCYG